MCGISIFIGWFNLSHDISGPSLSEGLNEILSFRLSQGMVCGGKSWFAGKWAGKTKRQRGRKLAETFPPPPDLLASQIRACTTMFGQCSSRREISPSDEDGCFYLCLTATWILVVHFCPYHVWEIPTRVKGHGKKIKGHGTQATTTPPKI
jgi:hypothetical protein